MAEPDPVADLAEPKRVQTEHSRPPGSRWWYLLLAVPFAALLWVPIYATDSPELLGFPFFYWYQFAWVPLTSLITWSVYRRVS